MRISLPYGTQQVSVELPDGCLINQYDPPYQRGVDNVDTEILRAIEHPIGCPRIEEIVGNGKTINLLIDDGSRPTPVKKILPVLLNKLERIGVTDEQIKIVIALGSHRYMTRDEMRERIGDDVFRRVKAVNSEFRNPDLLTFVGRVNDEINVFVSKAVMDSDIRIGIGNLVPHPVMGWSGGGKILFPGVTGEETVAYFHLKASLLNKNYFGDESMPIRRMMEKWVDSIGLHFIINTILTNESELAAVTAGHYIAAHRAGVEIGKKVLGSRITEKADVVITSSFPADQDFWQSPKAAYAAEKALKGPSGGTIILVSPNTEGVGPHPEFLTWMGRDDGDDMARRLISGERSEDDPLAIAVGNSMSKMRRRRKILIVSDGVNEQQMRMCGCGYYPLKDLQNAIDYAICDDQKTRVAVISKGAETYLYE